MRSGHAMNFTAAMVRQGKSLVREGFGPPPRANRPYSLLEPLFDLAELCISTLTATFLRFWSLQVTDELGLALQDCLVYQAIHGWPTVAKQNRDSFHAKQIQALRLALPRDERGRNGHHLRTGVPAQSGRVRNAQETPREE